MSWWILFVLQEKYIICYVFDQMQELSALKASIGNFQQISGKNLSFPHQTLA